MKLARCLLLLCLGCTLPTLATETREQTFQVGVDVNAQGEVTGTQPQTDTPKAFASLLDLALKHWRFMPTQHNGRAVAVHTFIEAKVEALPGENGKYTVRVSYARHGPAWNHAPAPHYPADSIRHREGGIVVVMGTVQSDGKIEISDTHNFIKGGNGGRSPLQKASTEWFTHLAVTPETVDGQAVPAHMRSYVMFHLDAYAPGEKKTALEPSMSAEEKSFLLREGFQDFGNEKDPGTMEISSVLQTSDVRPINLQL